MDLIILDFFVKHRTDLLSFFMLSITYFGNYFMIFGITLLSIISFWIHKQKSYILPMIISVAGSSIFTIIIKFLLKRPRPIDESFYIENMPSFPSGHATLAISLYGFLFYVIWKHDKHHLKNPFIIFLSILIPFIGISRLYLGVHYFSDVLVGYIIGTIWLILSLKLINKK